MNLFIALARDFLRDKRGNVAMMFAIAMMPLMIGAGAGLDFVRAMMVRQQMAEALDAAALAVGSTPGLDQTTAQALAQQYFDANYTVDKAQYGTVTINPPIYDAKGSVSLTATNNMPTVLMKLAGITGIPVSTTSTVVWGQNKLWVSLVLDNSGSMCEPDNSAGPCKNTTNQSTKIWQLKDATKTMLTKLQAVSTTAGDVRVSIVPFNRVVGISTGLVNANWIYWGYWEAEPPNANLNNVVDTTGPDDNCPWKLGSKGYGCKGAGGIAADGLLCPGSDNGSFNSARKGHDYNGCYTSEPTGTTKEVDSGKGASCGNEQHCTCSGNGKSKHCDADLYKHVWTPNPHSTWGGCITDRAQDYDISNAIPSGSDTSGFPADNPSSANTYNCTDGKVTALEYDWSDLTAQVDAIQALGKTNQPIGVAHGWQTLTTGGAYGAPALPANTTRYIILFSDGNNTQNRWSTDPSDIDDRMELVCDAAKADGVVIYTLYVHAGGGGDPDPLKNCASDTSKFYDLTSSAQIATAFADITKKITNVRVSM